MGRGEVGGGIPTQTRAGRDGGRNGSVVILQRSGGGNGPTAGDIEAGAVGSGEAGVGNVVGGIKAPTDAAQSTGLAPLKHDVMSEGKTENRVSVVTHETAESAGGEGGDSSDRNHKIAAGNHRAKLLRKSLATGTAGVGDGDEEVRQNKVELNLRQRGDDSVGGGRGEKALDVSGQSGHKLLDLNLGGHG